MRYIIIDKDSRIVKSVTDIPFHYEYPVQDGEELITGYEDFVFNLMGSDYYFGDGEFTEAVRI